MSKDFQSTLALIIVGMTALAFLARYIRHRGKNGCAGWCGCSFSKNIPRQTALRAESRFASPSADN